MIPARHASVTLAESQQVLAFLDVSTQLSFTAQLSLLMSVFTKVNPAQVGKSTHACRHCSTVVIIPFARFKVPPESKSCPP